MIFRIPGELVTGNVLRRTCTAARGDSGSVFLRIRVEQQLLKLFISVFDLHLPHAEAVLSQRMHGYFRRRLAFKYAGKWFYSLSSGIQFANRTKNSSMEPKNEVGTESEK